MVTDLEIARSGKMRSIVDVAGDLGLSLDDLELYGRHKAKISWAAVRSLLGGGRRRGKLVLVTAITPTRAGEGKTTVTIGLAQALCHLGERAIAAIRQPSLGPVFGMKGGAAGGGYAQVLPMEDINLHFTGDMHAVAAANNLLAAMTDNHIYHGNSLQIDSRTIVHRRVVDMNDRALRHCVIALGGRENGYPRESGYEITAASEVMAILCLSQSLSELKERLSAIVVARDLQSRPVTAGQLGAHRAMACLLRDAVKPNLVQTLEGTPAFVHGGPFANIAHGCSSVIATRLALALGEVVVTEGGFGADLGFEKFCDIVAAPRLPDLKPDAAVLVVTARALKAHGGVAGEDLDKENLVALGDGLANLDRHFSIIEQSAIPAVVAINRFAGDTEAEIAAIYDHCRKKRLATAVCDVFAEGGRGGKLLAESVQEALQKPGSFRPFYGVDELLADKLKALVTKVYGGAGFALSREAEKQLKWLAAHGFDRLPLCVAKTQYSLSDDPAQTGAPSGFTFHVRDFHLCAGAGFVVALAGEITTMPGLPAHPSALAMDVDEEAEIVSMS